MTERSDIRGLGLEERETPAATRRRRVRKDHAVLLGAEMRLCAGVQVDRGVLPVLDRYLAGGRVDLSQGIEVVEQRAVMLRIVSSSASAEVKRIAGSPTAVTASSSPS